MAETAVLNQLQIRRRELENEVASLSQKEITLKSELKKLEESIIAKLEVAIKDKKMLLSDLESKKTNLEKKLAEAQSNIADQPQQKTTQHNFNEEANFEIAVVEGQTEHTQTK